VFYIHNSVALSGEHSAFQVNHSLINKKTSPSFKHWGSSCLSSARRIRYCEEAALLTIDFNRNGASCGAMSTQNMEEGASANLVLNQFFRNGYDFAGWNTEPNGSGSSYEDGSVFIMGSSNLTLYAQWSESSSVTNTGDFRSRTSGNWGSNTTWEKFDGNCWLSCASGDYPNSSTVSVRIGNGHIIDNDGSGSPPWNVKDLTVDKGGKLWDNQFGGINTYVQIYGDIVCNGVIGDSLGDDIAFDIAGGNNCSISGIGSFTAMRIRKDDEIFPALNTSLTIEMDIRLLRPETSGTVLYNDANQPGTDLIGSLFNVSISPGVTVKCSGKGSAMSNLSIDGLIGADPENCGGLFVISGTLDIDGIVYCKNNNSAKNTALNIKSGGVLKCRYIETGASGLAGNTLSIENGGKLIIFGSVDTSIAHLNNTTWNNFSNTNNTWDFQSCSSIEYSGTNEQKIHGITGCSNLVVSGGGLKVIGNDFTVKDLLKLVNGIVQTGNNKLIHESTNPSDLIHSASGSSFIFGTYRRYLGLNSFIYKFPVGLSSTSSGYRRMDLVNNYLNGVAYLDVSVFSIDEISNNIDERLICTQDGFSLKNVIGNVIWKLSPNTHPLGGTYGVRLFLDGTGLTSNDDNNFCAVKRADGLADYTAWDTFFATTIIPSHGTDGRIYGSGDGYAERTGYTSFSEHAIGLMQPIQPLPIELINFSVSCSENNNVNIHWSTASEHNSSHFVVEKLNAGLLWQELGEVSAAGNSIVPLNYYMEDRIASEITYYRLLEVDLNGEKLAFEPISILCKASDISLFTFPNPSHQKFKLIYHSVIDNYDVTIQITDAHGKEVYSISRSVYSGINNIPITELNLQPGVYFIHVFSPEGKDYVIRQYIY
jgi:uncharacterized repeat protein (TIGR02543 family)